MGSVLIEAIVSKVVAGARYNQRRHPGKPEQGIGGWK
jgi:hypothetical protein